jgi:hypothetical protein
VAKEYKRGKKPGFTEIYIMEKYLPTVYYAGNNDSDIVFAEFPHNLKVDLTKAKEMVANRLFLTQNKKHFLVVDVSNVRAVTQEAKEFLQRSENGLKNILGAAFVATNPISTLIANIFVKTPKDFEARFFSNKEDAFDWIIEYRKKIMSNIPE